MNQQPTSQPVKPYSSTGSKKDQVGKMFDNIAPTYDFLNRFLSLGIDTIWRKKMVAELNATQHRHLLDVATGTADVALEIQKQLQPEHITGVDISHEMLNVGRKKIAKRNLTERITLQYGDSEALPFEDDRFDALTVAFGVRNYENLDQGLAEMRRVLKPGGKLVVLEFSRPTAFPLKQGFNFYFKNVLPLIGRLQSGDARAYDYLYESVQEFPDGARFRERLERAGFTNPHEQRLTVGIASIYTGIA